MSEPTPDTLTQRLDRLERENRWWRAASLVSLLLLVVIGLIAQTTARVPDELRAKKFVAVDDKGRSLVELFAQSGPARAGLSLFDGGGNQVAYFTVFPGSSITGLSLSGGKGEPSISLSAMSNAMLNALNRGGVLGGHPASIVLKDSSEEPRIELKPWCAMPTATRAIPDQESSHVRSAQRVRS